jgi:hypothetical protein
VCITTESRSKPSLNIYRSLVKIPEGYLKVDSEFWIVPGTPQPDVYKLSAGLGSSMSDVLNDIDEPTATIEFPMHLLMTVSAPLSEVTTDQTPIMNQAACRSSSFVERICTSEGSPPTLQVLQVGNPLTTGYIIHDTPDHEGSIFHIYYRAHGRTLHTYIHHHSCYYRTVFVSPVQRGQSVFFDSK